MSRDSIISEKLKECIIYNGLSGLEPIKGTLGTEVIVEHTDVISSMANHFDSKLHCAVLNHMCYKEPAPYYLSGAPGREEELCKHSCLYNILLECKDFYSYNKKHKNRGLCENRALYIPKLPFNTESGSVVFSVIGLQAPDWKHCGLQYHMFTEEENYKALKERIKLIFDIAFLNHVDILILGAFGCKVYGQKADIVATIFKECLQGDFQGCFRKIIIPIDSQESYDKFEKVFAVD